MTDTNRFIINFIFLAILNGIAVGMGKIITTLYAISIGASSMQIGFITSMESLGKVLVTLPAGFIIARYGARNIYILTSIVPMLLTWPLPLCHSWYTIGTLRGLASLCIPFRVVAMNSSFLQCLDEIGSQKAGWYRGSRAIGLGLLGPIFASFFTDNYSYLSAFIFIGACFGIMAFYGNRILPGSHREDDADTDGSHESFVQQIKTLFRNPPIANSMIIEFLNSSTNILFSTFIILITIKISGMTSRDGIHLLVIEGFTSVTALFFLGYLVKTLSTKIAYIISISLAATGLYLLGTAHNFIVFCLGTMALSLGSSLIHIVNTWQLSRSKMSKSKISGIYNLAGILGGMFGGCVGGIASNFVALQSLFLYWIPFVFTVLFISNYKTIHNTSFYSKPN